MNLDWLSGWTCIQSMKSVHVSTRSILVNRNLPWNNFSVKSWRHHQKKLATISSHCIFSSLNGSKSSTLGSFRHGSPIETFHASAAKLAFLKHNEQRFGPYL